MCVCVCVRACPCVSVSVPAVRPQDDVKAGGLKDQQVLGVWGLLPAVPAKHRDSALPTEGEGRRGRAGLGQGEVAVGVILPMSLLSCMPGWFEAEQLFCCFSIFYYIIFINIFMITWRTLKWQCMVKLNKIKQIMDCMKTLYFLQHTYIINPQIPDVYILLFLPVADARTNRQPWTLSRRRPTCGCTSSAWTWRAALTLNVSPLLPSLCSSCPGEGWDALISWSFLGEW